MRRAGVELSVVVPVYNEERRLPGSLVGLIVGYAAQQYESTKYEARSTRV